MSPYGGILYCLLELRHVENDKVLVSIIEVASVPLVEHVDKLRFSVVVTRDSRVKVGDAQGVLVEQHAQNAGDCNGVTAGGLDGYFGDFRKAVIGAGALPVGNSLSVGEADLGGVEGGAVQISLSPTLELVQHDKLLVADGRETLLAAHIKQGRESRQTGAIFVHQGGCEGQKVPIVETIRGGYGGVSGSVLVQLQEVHGAGVGIQGVVRLRLEIGVNSLTNHVVNGSGNQNIIGEGHCIFNAVVDTLHKGGRRSCGSHGTLELLFGDGEFYLEGRPVAEEFGGYLGGLEDVLIVGRAVGQLPRLVFGVFGGFECHFLQNGTILPTVHQDRGGTPGIFPDDENLAANDVN